jgi:Tfp pilus assembly protein PilV
MTLRDGKRDAAPGQSMLEAIIALGIIVTAVSSALTLTTSTIRAEKDSEASITAGNLAREGVEAVRSIRDSNWLAGSAFDASLSSGTDYTGIPVFDPSTNAWTVNYGAVSAVSDANAKVYRYSTGSGNATVGLFVNAATQPGSTVTTPYSRIVTTDPLCDNGTGGYTIVTSGSGCGAAEKVGMRVTSIVRWTVQTRVHTLSAEERMLNWR